MTEGVQCSAVSCNRVDDGRAEFFLSNQPQKVLKRVETLGGGGR